MHQNPLSWAQRYHFIRTVFIVIVVNLGLSSEIVYTLYNSTEVVHTAF